MGGMRNEEEEKREEDEEEEQKRDSRTATLTEPNACFDLPGGVLCAAANNQLTRARSHCSPQAYVSYYQTGSSIDNAPLPPIAIHGHLFTLSSLSRIQSADMK